MQRELGTWRLVPGSWVIPARMAVMIKSALSSEVVSGHFCGFKLYSRRLSHSSEFDLILLAAWHFVLGVRLGAGSMGAWKSFAVRMAVMSTSNLRYQLRWSPASFADSTCFRIVRALPLHAIVTACLVLPARCRESLVRGVWFQVLG